jgi:nitrilase
VSRIAIIQEAPSVLDREGTIARAAAIVDEAAAQGIQLVVFPEAYVPGYPAWIWRLRPGGDWGTCEEIHTRLLNNAVDTTGKDLQPLREAARRCEVTVVLGINERDSASSRATLYNSVVTIGCDGEIANHHRKLMPTNPERMVWGMGDASGLNVIDTPVGRTGTLICWENYMPLARYALYSQGIEVYIAPTYDSGEGWIGTMQHIAREGRCWVLCAGVALQRADLPEDFPDLENLYPDGEDWINPGDSVVVAPGGEIVAGPAHREKTWLVVDIDTEKAATAKRALDVAGHYARPDVFSLQVDRSARSPATFIETD